MQYLDGKVSESDSRHPKVAIQGTNVNRKVVLLILPLRSVYLPELFQVCPHQENYPKATSRFGAEPKS